MSNLSGKYRFNTKVGNVPEAVFLYKKLQLETRPFEYQSQSKSWELRQAPRPVSLTGQQQLIAFEISDNTGDYDSLANAKDQKRKTTKKDVPCVPNAPGDVTPGEDTRQMVVLWAIRQPELVPAASIIAGNLSGYEGETSGNPFGGDYSGITPISESSYVFVNKPYASEANFCDGYKGYMPVSDPIFCYNPPSGVNGVISYKLNVVWRPDAFRPATNSPGFNGIFYQDNNPDPDVPDSIFFRDCADNTFCARMTAEWQPVAGDVADLLALNSCGSDSLDGWWLTQGDEGGAQAVNILMQSPGVYLLPSQLSHIYDYICWQGQVADYPAWESYMNSMLEFWGILANGAELTLVGCMVINNVGGYCSPSPTGPFPPDPNPAEAPLIGLGQYHGRYCDIFVNYQKNGIVKELKLPIDFPCRVTHIVCEYEELYSPYLPMETPGQRIEAPSFSYASEWFSGRVNIDRDNIYVDIIYEIIREYEPDLKVVPNGILDPNEGGVNMNIERPGVIFRYLSQANNFIDFECATSRPEEQVWARPTRDKFNKIVRYTINKSSFTIVNTETFTGSHPTSANLFTDSFLQDNTILNISQRHDYKQYHDVNNVDKEYVSPGYETPSVLPASGEYKGYIGLPTPYFQVDCRPNAVTIFSGSGNITPNYIIIPDTDYTASLVNDLLTLKVDWNDIYWVFYLLMERPYINRTDLGKLIDFQDRCQNRGVGYNKTQNKFYLSYIGGIGFDGFFTNRDALVAPGFFELYMEHERLRGYPIIKDGKIKRWLRLKPESFPLFEANRFY